MSKPYPYFKFWAKDWSTDEKIKLMPREAKGLYIDMLVHCWIEGSVPADLKSISILFSVTKRTFSRLFSHFSDGFVEKDGRYFSKRLEIERDKMIKKSESMAENGRIGGSKTKAIASDLHKQNQTISDTQSDSDPDIYKSSVNSVSPEGEKTEPVNKWDPRTCYQISKHINDHDGVFSESCPIDSRLVQKLYLCLRRTPGFDPEGQRVLAYLIQGKESPKPKDQKSRLGYVINLLKKPKYAPSDSCMQKAKELLLKWTDGDAGEKAA